MKENPLEVVKKAANPKPNIHKCSQVVHSVDVRLARQHHIQESPSTQNDITEAVFNKLTTINKITENVLINSYLNSLKLKKTAELQSLKAQLNELVTSKNNDEIVNDLIGG